VAAVLNEFGLLNTEHLCGKAALWFARRAVTLEGKHPTAELWAAEPRGAEQSEARRYEEIVKCKAMQLDNREASEILQQRQLNQRWDADDKQNEPPVKLLKWITGPALLLFTFQRKTSLHAAMRTPSPRQCRLSNSPPRCQHCR
jgi:hypothetical protein